MKRAYKLLTLGIWIAILPYLGFPYFWKNILFTISGLGLVYFSYILYKESRTVENIGERIFDNFSENKDFNENETNRMEEDGAQN